MRLDQAIVEKYPELSRALSSKFISEGKVSVNDKLITKPSYQVNAEDEVVLNEDIDKLKIVPDIDLPILYEDDDCIVINKPEGVLTHSKGAFNPEATVASFIKPYLKFSTEDIDRQGNNDRLGIVHRLDRATSGVMICAKTHEATLWLQKQFADRKVKKTYIAVIYGVLEPMEAIIDMPIARNPKNPKTFYVSPNGKVAQTHYRITEQFSNNRSLVWLQPETGRTHQLRVHLAFQGHPIVGDVLYGGSKFDRMLLHANKLEITLPNKQYREFVADIPKEFHNG